MDDCFYQLDAPVIRVAAEDVPIPYNRRLEAEVIPSTRDIVEGVQKALE
jgi:pyruvate dehydrogenase E1 component beta subunit